MSFDNLKMCKERVEWFIKENEELKTKLAEVEKIAEKARAFNSMDWVILKAGIMEFNDTHKVDELLNKFEAFRDAILGVGKGEKP